MVHHIAIGTPNPSRLADFLLNLPGFSRDREFYWESGELRSIWLKTGELLLMLEAGPKQAPKAIVVFCDSSDKTPWTSKLELLTRTKSTEFTQYFLDPDGNTWGVTTYPIPWDLT